MQIDIDTSDRKEIGRTGETVSAIGIGSWAIRDRRKAIEALVYAFENGIDNVDTAEMYGDGEAERVVGEAIKSVGRDRVFVTTKLLPHRFRSRDAALNATRESLRRLGIQVVDLVLIHWPDYATPLEVQIRNLEAIAEAGLARYIGVSNFNAGLLEKAFTLTRSHELVVDQVKYSILDRSIETDLLPLAVERGVTMQAYTPIERGRVAEVELIKELAEKYGRTPIQIALNYLISMPRVVAIPKSERVERVREFIGAMGWRLSREDVERIRGL